MTHDSGKLALLREGKVLRVFSNCSLKTSGIDEETVRMMTVMIVRQRHYASPALMIGVQVLGR